MGKPITTKTAKKIASGLKKTGKFMGKSNKLGGGGRFAQLKTKIEKNIKPRAGETKAQAAAAVTASIGRKALGKAKFQSLAAKARKGKK